MATQKFVVAAAALFACAVGTVHAQVKWDMPTPYPDTNFHTKNVRQFVDEIGKGTGGKLQITVHPANSLIKHPEIKRAVQTGQVPIAEVLISILSNEAAVFAFESNPFLSTSYAQQRKLWAAARPVLEKRLDGQGVTLLYSVPWPPSGIHTRKEISSLADFKGLKMRSFNPITSRVGELVGATPVLVAAPEVPQAFTSGIINAQINSSAGGVDTQTWDHTTHFYDVQMFMPQNVVAVNKAAFGRLDAATQKIIRDAAAAAETRGWATSEEENTRNIQTLAGKGVKIMKPSEKLAAELREIGKRMLTDWEAKGGDEAKAILKAFGN